MLRARVQVEVQACQLNACVCVWAYATRLRGGGVVLCGWSDGWMRCGGDLILCVMFTEGDGCLRLGMWL